MIQRPRTPVLLAGSVALVLGLAGCSSSSKADAPVPDAHAAAGGYRLTTVISASTIASNQAGADSKISTSLVLSCADPACTSLLQRSPSTALPQGNTVQLSAVAGGFRGQHIGSGTCGGGIQGDFGESFAWDWKSHDDGTLTGTLVQKFKGCDVDGSTTYQATAIPAATKSLPYLPTATARRWVRDVNAYDVELSKVYVSGTECNTVASTTTPAEATCFARTYAAWRPDIDRLARQTSPLATHASAECRGALTAIRFGTWSTLVGDAATAYRAAHDKAGVKAGVRAEGTATTFATAQHARVVTALAVCTDPAIAGSLGKAGVLGVDPDSVLQPLAG